MTTGARMWVSEVDSSRFGVKVVRAEFVRPGDVEAVLTFRRKQGATLLMARCPVDDVRAVQLLERVGCFMTGTVIRCCRSLAGELPAVPTDAFPVRRFEAGDESAVVWVAERAFADMPGHYHADPRLSRDDATAAYRDWAQRACTAPAANEWMLVADGGEGPVGFGLLRLGEREAVGGWGSSASTPASGHDGLPLEGHGVLFGVDPSARRQGVMSSLVLHGMYQFRERGAETMVYVTHLVNLPAIRAISRLGFEYDGAQHTLHGWFDEEDGNAAYWAGEAARDAEAHR